MTWHSYCNQYLWICRIEHKKTKTMYYPTAFISFMKISWPRKEPSLDSRSPPDDPPLGPDHQCNEVKYNLILFYADVCTELLSNRNSRSSFRLWVSFPFSFFLFISCSPITSSNATRTRSSCFRHGFFTVSAFSERWHRWIRLAAWGKAVRGVGGPWPRVKEATKGALELVWVYTILLQQIARLPSTDTEKHTH